MTATKTEPTAETVTLKAELFATTADAAKANRTRKQSFWYVNTIHGGLIALADTKHQAEQATLDFMCVNARKLSTQEVLDRVAASLSESQDAE